MIEIWFGVSRDATKSGTTTRVPENGFAAIRRFDHAVDSIKTTQCN